METKRKNSRAKGHGFERVVAKLLNDAFISQGIENPRFKRVPQSGGFDKTLFPGDVISLNDDLRKMCPSIECKFYADWKIEDLITPGSKASIYDWLNQAADDAGQCLFNPKPMLIIKKNNCTPFVLLSREYYLSLIQKSEDQYGTMFIFSTNDDVRKKYGTLIMVEMTKAINHMVLSISQKYKVKTNGTDRPADNQ